MIDIPTPYNQYAEEFILASTFLDGRVVGDLIASGVSEDTFHDGTHQDIWRIVKQFYAEGTVFDEVGVAQELKEKYDYAEPMSVVNTISKAAETTTSTPIYMKTCIDTERRRKLLRAAITCVDSVRKEMEPTDIQSNLLKSIEGNESHGKPDVNVGEVANAVIDSIRERNERRIGLVGLSCGFPAIDQLTGGFRKKAMVVVAGRAKTGKTTLVINFMIHALRSGVAIRFWSLEMAPEEIEEKMLACMSGVDINRASDGLLTQADLAQLNKAREELSNLPLLIKDTAFLTTDLVATQHRQDITKHGNVVCIIDYLQLMHNPDRKLSREEQISEMSRNLKLLWKDTDTTGIVLSQLNRQVGEAEEPQPRHLKGSGAIEQDLDCLIFVYNHPDGSHSNIKVGLNRKGQTGIRTLKFQRHISRFVQP